MSTKGSLLLVFHTQAAAATEQMRRAKQGLRLFHSGNTGGGSVLLSPEQTKSVHKDVVNYSAFCAASFFCASTGPKPASAKSTEQKTYHLYPSNTFHLNSFLI